jgi:hypothetical protein
MRHPIFSALVVCGLLSIGFVSSCTDNGPALTETHNADGKDFTIRVTTFESGAKLQKYIDDNDLTTESVDGLAQWRITKDMSQLRRCDIYVVKPSSPRDYDVMETWGHELVHCVYGSFHKDGVR